MAVRPTMIVALFAVLSAGPAVAQELPTGAQSLAPDRYLDVPEDHWAADAIRRLSRLGILTGYPDETFRGQQQATRYELAVVAARLLDILAESLAELGLEPPFRDGGAGEAELLQRVQRVEEALAADRDERLGELEARIVALEHLVAALLEGDLTAPGVADSDSGGAGGAVRAETRPPLAGIDPSATNADGQSVDSETGVVTAGGASRYDFWTGVAVGYPFPANVHLGLREPWPALSFRAGVGLTGGNAFGLELTAIYSLPAAPDSLLQPYLAAGFDLTLGEAGGARALALGGLDIRLSPAPTERSFIFLEVGPAFPLGDEGNVEVVGRAGLGLRF